VKALVMKTAKYLCVRSGIARAEMTEEAQKLFDLYNDPSVSQEEKEAAKTKLDGLIKQLEEKVQTARRVRGDFQQGNP
jgi:hypothetical protein